MKNITFFCEPVLLLFCAWVAIVCGFYDGEFRSHVWQFDHIQSLDKNARVKFLVALKLKNVEELQFAFHEASNPHSALYGKFLSLSEVYERYGPSREQKQKVVDYLLQHIDGADVDVGEHGDILEVVASVQSIEQGFGTSLAITHNARGVTDKISVRARKALVIPKEVKELMSFISLNSPVNHVKARGTKALKNRKQHKTKDVEIDADKSISDASGILDRQNADSSPMGQKSSSIAVDGISFSETTILGVRSGNEEALVHFTPTCGGGGGDGSSSVTNSNSPPCADLPIQDIPEFLFEVTTHANNVTNPYQLDTDPMSFVVPSSMVYCYSLVTRETCSGPTTSANCSCVAKLSPLPKYTQLRVNASMHFPDSPTDPDVFFQLGTTFLFALTDVATAPFLSRLYNMPPGISVHHGSNQSVAEFYGEFYSNSDLQTFLALSGLPNASIPDTNVRGDLPNDQSKPGGEAQLDVEYIMAMAPGADTYFYSMGDYNPNDPANTTINEGFLAYLTLVNSDEFPPLVHSLSYGDVEAEIFNASNSGSVEYGERCNQEFMKMGLRGLTVLVSSGDDGIGSQIVRGDPDQACAKAHPEWPASSPYVTAIGATQLTDKYLPICGKPYGPSRYYPEMPAQSHLRFECSDTGETVCTSTLGGIITSGGGFSDVHDRATYAPWQLDTVNYYLRSSNAAAYPPLSHFSPQGRGYPDVSTYGSNYFIYLDGRVVRESGTSASAPVFAAMVTLWNDIRLAYGMPPLGFIAPFLYYAHAAAPDAFNDVVTGNNACGVGSSLETTNCCEYSFSAVPGWDAATGLGTPNFDVIANLVLNYATYFPNMGAYPNAGASSDSPSSGNSGDGGGEEGNIVNNNNDDDDDFDPKVLFDIAVAGLVFGLLSLCIAVFAAVVAVKARKDLSAATGGGGRGGSSRSGGAGSGVAMRRLGGNNSSSNPMQSGTGLMDDMSGHN